MTFLYLMFGNTQVLHCVDVQHSKVYHACDYDKSYLLKCNAA
jgi:hypothetical protein